METHRLFNFLYDYNNKIIITYEDLCIENTNEVMKNIFDFLKVSYEETETNLQKITKDNLREAIENYDDFKKVLIKRYSLLENYFED